MPSTTPVITGTGIICAAGCGLPAVWESIREGRSGLKPLTLFPSARYGKHLVGEVPENVDRLAGPVRGSRSDKLAWIAGRQALQEADLLGLDHVDAERVGVVIGATVGGMRGTERALEELLTAKRHRFGAFRFHECASSADLCAQMLGARGPCATVSTACSAGAMALIMAAELIQSGAVDAVLAGGTDSLCRLTLNGFGSLLLLDPSGCRPFDTRRTGISLGEGAAMLVLEPEERARQRGTRILARLSGWGASCDAWHATAPDPEGRGALAAMEKALESAQLRPSDISFVSAHGTGTPDNDAMEARALRRLFSAELPPVSSVKRFFGHTLAASGAIKAVLAVRTLLEQAIPPSLGFAEPDPKIGFEPVREYAQVPVANVLSNSFGFGGNNVALVLSKSGDERRHSQPVYQASSAPLAITGASVICAAGQSLEELVSALKNGAAVMPVPQTVGEDTSSKISAYVCDGLGSDASIDADKKRRLSRFQEMAIAAARLSAPAPAACSPARVCVAFGTGLGSLKDTAAFLENLVLKQEKAPRPLLFTNSVHNTLAAQVAIEFGYQGLNSTPVHREISFEIALWQAARELASARADYGIVGAADELSPYQIMAGRRWAWWDEHTRAIVPFSEDLRRGERPLPGEGCGCVVLCREPAQAPPLGHLSMVAFGRTQTGSGSQVDAAAEARWLRDKIAQSGGELNSVDLLLTGANGGKVDETYASISQEFSRLAGRQIPCGAYKHWCGEFASASAIGFVIALGLVRGEIPLGASLPFNTPGKNETGVPRQVILYTLGRGGTKSVCGVIA